MATDSATHPSLVNLETRLGLAGSRNGFPNECQATAGYCHRRPNELPKKQPYITTTSITSVTNARLERGGRHEPQGFKIRRGVSNPGSGVIPTKVVSFHSVSLRDMMITLQGGWNPPSGSLPWLPAHAAHRPLLRPKIDKIVVFRISKFAQKTDRPKITFFRICW